MADDEDTRGPPGEFPPGLEALNAEIERLASRQRSSEDIREQAERVAEQALPFVNEARRVLAQARGDTDALGAQLREALAEVSAEAPSTLSGVGSLNIGGTAYPALAVTGRGNLALRGLSMSGVGAVGSLGVALSDAGAGVDSLKVHKSRRVLDWLPPAYVFYITLIWLLLGVGIPVVMERFDLPPDVVQQLQTDPNYVGLALELTILILASRKRK